MAIPKAHEAGDVGLVFVAHNNHDERCGPPPRLRNTDNLDLYCGYFENRHGEQFVFSFDRGSGQAIRAHLVKQSGPTWVIST